MKADASVTGISIAGVHFVMASHDVPLPEDLFANSAYPLFQLQTAHPVLSHDRVNIHITRQPAPDLSKSRRLFDSRTAWNVCGDGPCYFITFDVPSALPPLWTAMIGPESDSVTVFCSDRMINAATGRLIFNPVSYPLDQILLMHFLAAAKGGICHAAGWHSNSRGIAFPGVSGRGKSTISRLLDLKAGNPPVSDDRVVIRLNAEKALLYGTPWPGEAGYAKNAAAPLAGIFFLSQGRENRISGLAANAAMERLLPVLSIPWYDKKMVSQMLDFGDALLGRVPAFDLIFRDDEEVVDVIERFLAD